MPLTSTPTLVHAETKTRVWLFDESATAVLETQGRLVTATAKFYATEFEAVLQARWVSKGRKVTYLHDWRRSPDYENGARDTLISWGRASIKHTAKVWVCVAPDASPFVRIAASTGISALKFARMPIDQTDDLEPLLAPLKLLQPVVL